MELQALNEETMIKIAVANLEDRFATVDRPNIEATVRRFVIDEYARAHVKNFVGVIAERRARIELQQRIGPQLS
jgi:hypothetical protein